MQPDNIYPLEYITTMLSAHIDRDASIIIECILSSEQLEKHLLDNPMLAVLSQDKKFIESLRFHHII